MKKQFDIKINGIPTKCNNEMLYQDLANIYQEKYENDILLVMEDEFLRELRSPIKANSNITFITAADDAGMSTYRRSVSMLMLKSIYDVCGKDNIKSVQINFSLSSGYFCTIDTLEPITNICTLLSKLEKRMMYLVNEALPFEKEIIKTQDAEDVFAEYGMADKAKLFKYRSASNTNVYKLGDFKDYFYGFMVPNTSYLKYFKLYPYDNGFVLQMPEKKEPKVTPEFTPSKNVYLALKESKKWADMLGVKSVGDVNEVIIRGDIQELILVQEALQEAKIAGMAQMIKKLNKKFIMIAGPSSSGKTTFSKRMCVQLLAHGLKPHAISVDNYYLERENTPLDENGNYDFENITAIDLKLFNDDMMALLNGKEISMPHFNFITGKREYHDDILKLGNKDVLVIEGIHCLNDDMSKNIPTDEKFRIYISALMMLNLDEHNRISTTDGRLIRRIVRDASTRGKAAAGTINMWDMVKKGEEKFIFPYQDNANVVFNSSLIYELFVMKQYARPLLLTIPKSAPEYVESKRLLKFFDYILDIPNDSVPANSLIREFIGGGCFKL